MPTSPSSPVFLGRWAENQNSAPNIYVWSPHPPQAGRQAGGQAGGQVGRQAGRQTDRQTHFLNPPEPTREVFIFSEFFQ